MDYLLKESAAVALTAGHGDRGCRGYIHVNAAVLCCLMALVLSAAAQAAGVEAISRPSDDRTLSFVIPGRIAEVTVKDGDRVKQGQLLARLDDAAEQVQLAQLRAQAGDTSRIEAAKAQTDQRRVELRRLQEADRPALEVDRAKLEVVIGELSHRLAELEQQQNAREVRRTEIQLDRMRMISPIDGLIEKVWLQAGEVADKERPVIRVVKIDPLRVDAPVPIDQAAALTVGQKALVTLKNAPTATREASIVYIAAEADAASNTLTVRVELPNPEFRSAGEHVVVTFPSPQAKE
jgi:RND family efflux transporter MFP subunit